MQLGRLYVTAYKTAGAGFHVRLVECGIQVWVGRLMIAVGLVHSRKCGCWECEYYRDLWHQD